jgi:hypothetical protein
MQTGKFVEMNQRPGVENDEHDISRGHAAPRRCRLANVW